jgi:hypothetical protein
MLDEKLIEWSEVPEGALVDVAARIYGCKVDELLSWSEKEDGSVVIIAPTGQKFTYSGLDIMQELVKETVLGCAGTGAVVYGHKNGLGDEKMVTGIRDPGADEQRSAAAVAKGKMVTTGPEPGASSVTKKDKEMVTPIASDSQSPDPDDDVLAQSASQVTKSEEKMVTDAAAAVAKDVTKSPAKRRSTRSRTKKAPSAGTGDPDK